ncbi:serine/threonine-protein kinase MRCK [Nematocida sp. AWRm78]|nr:serine/threonine-protein kinase MRCK [Nematocida sp. AWRm79]KAI5183216.1 serine/threonine-protein kinase MRCK [Nematocida sp. AWRm78]
MRQKELLLGNKELDLLIDCAQAINLSGASIPGIDKIVDVVDTVDDYETVHALAKGGHSEVFVVRCKSDGKIYALKKVFKQDIINDPLVNPIMKERESMICGRNSEWLLGLHKSFQDRNALYFLTDFIPGGDLGSLSCREGVLPERMIRFFIGELLMALKELHGLGFVHRDIKPENVLIDSDGHIKLADFGSTTSLSADDHHVVVGTPDYVAPELLNMCGGLSVKTDLWSLGVVVYELAFGCSPFYHDTIRGTYDNIMNIRYTMEETGSAELHDLIKNLLCEKESRLSLDEIMSHAFFTGFDFSGKSANKAEYIPTVLSVESVENFEVDEFMPAQTTLLNTMDNARKFIGFGYDPDIRAEIAKEKKPESSTEENCLDKICIGAEVTSACSSSNSTLSVEKESVEEVIQDCSSICSLCKKLTAPLQEEAISDVAITKEKGLEEECQEESKASDELADTEESDKSTSGQVYDESAQDKEPIITNIEISKKDLQDRKKSLDVSQASEEASFANINTQLDINLECSQEKEKVSAVEKIVKNEDFVCFSGNLGEDLEKKKAQKERENIIAYICEIEESFKMGYEHLLKIDTSPLVKSMEYIEQEIQGFIAAVKESQRRESESAFQARWVIRKLQTEIRDTQGRIEREVETRLKLTEQIEEARLENKELREQIRRLKLASNVYNFPIKIYVDKKWESSTLQLEEDYLRIKDICLPLNKIYFQDIKKNELLRINSKAELLSFKLLLPSEDDVYTEQTESSSDQVACTGENAELKKELEKELQILEGIEKMIRSTSTSCKTIIPMALKQKEGTEKKISEIQQALSQGFAADPTIIRYNNHTFKVTTFKQGVQNWCHVCNRLLYGETKQGLLCKGCKMVCHKECHTLIVYSCELQQAMERGTSIILMAKQLEDKDRIKAIVGSGQP